MFPMKESLVRLYEQTFGCRPSAYEEIPACGSYRRYCRLQAPVQQPLDGRCGRDVPASVIGCWNADKKENAAFVSFARSFRAAGLPVPEIYAVDEAADIYLQQDLGSQSLYDRVKTEWIDLLEAAEEPKNGGLAGNNTNPECKAALEFPESLKELYRRVLQQLVRLQLAGRTAIDYSKCTPCPAFHRDAIHWDLNYFKYFFLKLLRVPFDEQALEDDFRSFSAWLLQAPCDCFLYRDFQSANVMLVDGNPWFIDFQGGRRGALQYDVASLLFDAKTRLPRAVRDELADYYWNCLEQALASDHSVISPTGAKSENSQAQPVPIALSYETFMGHYQGYTLCRLLQALAAFGLRGVVEHKPGFRESIPPALEMVRDLLSDWRIPVDVPELRACLERMQSVSV